MPTRLTRSQGLVDRYRVDRRLPPSTRALYERTMPLVARDAGARRLAATRPVLGIGMSAPVGRYGRRRLRTAGVLSQPMSAIAIETARIVVDELIADGVDAFVTARWGDRVEVGIGLGQRGALIECLARLGRAPGWFVEWHDRGSTGLCELGSIARSSRARNARRLAVFRSFAVGERATGPELGVDLTFWTPGPSGQLEQVGERGQARFDARSAPTTELLDGVEFPSRAAFLPGRSLERLDAPVDVVYTWVDGSDAAWSDAFRRTAEEVGRDLDEEALDAARYHSRDELKYSLRSLWMYTGWVRNIYVITAGQRPAWLAEDPRVTVVDHSEIFPASALPTFNSHSIEATLHRIPGLAEHFIYFNDDMFLTRPSRPETFFHPNGLPYWFPSDARVPGVEDDDTQIVDTAARRGRELLLRRFGRAISHKPLHSPYPLLKSVVQEIEREFPDVIDSTRHSRFRSPSDLSVAASFAQHYGFASGRGVAGTIETEYVHVESGRLKLHLDRIKLDPELDTCCINETARTSDAFAEREQMLERFFEERFPVPAPWERR